MLGVFLRLVFIEQRHDLPHHNVHWIVAHFLGDRDQPDAVLGELADVEFQFEMVAEEAAERMDDYDVEQRGLAGSRLDHALEFRAAVVGSGRRTKVATAGETTRKSKPARQHGLAGKGPEDSKTRTGAENGRAGQKFPYAGLTFVRRGRKADPASM